MMSQLKKIQKFGLKTGIVTTLVEAFANFGRVNVKWKIYGELHHSMQTDLL